MIFKFMEDNDILNFGYIILLDDKPNLSILLNNHDFINDISLDLPDNIFNSIDSYDLYIVGITLTDDNGYMVEAEDLETEEDFEEVMYNITPLYSYKIKTLGLKTEDFVDLELINILFYDILDGYIKERV